MRKIVASSLDPKNMLFFFFFFGFHVADINVMIITFVFSLTAQLVSAQLAPKINSSTYYIFVDGWVKLDFILKNKK